MLSIKAQKRQEKGKKVKNLRTEGKIPAVLYGPRMKEVLLQVDRKEFDKVYQQAGESSLITLRVDEREEPVLIYDLQRNPLSRQFIHIDFYQPPLNKPIEITVPLMFEGVSPAVRDLGGTLLKNIQEVKISALPQNLPHEIRVNIEKLVSFEDKIFVKDIVKEDAIKILRNPDEIVAQILEPEKVEEELAKPIEEKVEEVEKVEKPKKEKDEDETKAASI